MVGAQSGANVGYAFVNFIDVSGVVEFAKAKLGRKWEMCQSDKVVQVRMPFLLYSFFRFLNMMSM
jgi:hypothetical protein